MKKLGLAAVLLAAAVLVSASPAGFLIRVERQSEADRLVLLDGQVPVVMELGACLLVMGDEEDLAWLAGHGYGAEILDGAPWLWEYYQVGLRADSDLASVMEVGTILYTEENWVLLQVPPEADLSRLADAKVFLARVPDETLKKPRYADETPRHPEATLAAVPLVQQMVNSVTDADIMSYWTALVPASPGSRYSTASGCTTAASYVYSQFTNLGLAAQQISYRTGYAPNVVGQITGALNPGTIYLVEGHLDDMPSSGYAPGADDNASGCVVVLEAAKALSCYAFKNTVRFLAVTGEEQGLYGSTDYAGDAYTAGENIQGVLNMDMVGWEGDNSPAGENLDLNYDSNSQSLGQFFAQCAADYGTGLAVDAFLCPSLNASDHYPFWQKGYKAVCGITDNEGYCSHGGSYDYYHTSNDTILNSGNGSSAHPFFYKVVRTSVAALAALGEPFKITTDKASYGTSETVTLIVGDKDLNTSASTVQTTAVLIASGAETTPESVVLTETGANSMIFRGTIVLTTSAAAHGDGKLSVAAGNTLTATYTDAQDCGGAANVTHTATATVSGATTYSISGTVSGAVTSGVTVTLSGAASGTTTTGTGGTYAFGGLANGTYTVTPALSGYAFSPTSLNVTISGANQTGKNFTATASSADTPLTSGVGVGGSVAYQAWKYYTIAVPGGATNLAITLTGLSADVDLYVNNSATHPTTSSYYGRSWNSGTTSESLSYTSPAAATWCIGAYGYAAGNFTVTATVTLPTATYSISGTVSGAVSSGVTMTLSGAASATATTGTGGAYTFSSLANGTYTVTPSRSGYTFSPTSLSVTLSGANQTGKNFTSSVVTTTYSISGTVSGAVSSGVTLTLSGAASATTTTGTGGTYTFGGLANGTYTVTPSKSGYTFSPTSLSVTLSGANQTGKNFTATASSTDTPLTSGAGVGTGSLSQGTYKYYTIAVPSGATHLAITLTGLSADLDLYVNNSTTHPTSSSSYGKSENGGTTSESLSYTSPTVATWCIGVYAYAAGSGTVTATVTMGTATYSISGTVSGAVTSGVTMTLSGAGSATTTTAAGGTYTFSGLANGTYTVTPGLSGYTFSPTSTSVTISGANQTGKNFTSTASGGSTTLFTNGFEGTTGWAQTDTYGTAGTWSQVTSGTYPTCSKHGGTYMSKFNSYNASASSATRYYRTSGFAVASSYTTVTLTFWMYHDTGYSTDLDKVQPQVSTNGTTWVNVGSPINRYDGSTGWKQHTVNISSYAGQSALRIAFLGTSAYGNNMFLDDVAVVGQ